MSVDEKYAEWLSFADDETACELKAAAKDRAELEDRFYKDLEFGTGGLRGVMGAGSNRMNIYTVGRATLGLAAYLKHSFPNGASVAVAYDTRNNSARFSLAAASLLAASGIKVFWYEYCVPVPVLSFTVRRLGCSAGIMITASHNPKEYNGYKVYDSTGCQICTEAAEELFGFIEKESYSDVARLLKCDSSFDSIGDGVLNEYYKAVSEQSLYERTNGLKVVYTPLHGTGNIPVRRMLRNFDVEVVKEQELPDGDFSTVRSPNPEERDALDIAVRLAAERGADIVLGTDPDCDRVGVAVRDKNGEYRLLTGNQTGALLVDFVLNMKKASLNSRSTLVKTIVTSELGADIARSYGLQVEETLTGFKFIGDKMNQYEKSGEHEFVIGYEESYGYLVGDYARDKDGVVSSMLICQMAAWHKGHGKTLVDALGDIYSKYGYYLDALDPFVLRGKNGAEKIKALMNDFRKNGFKTFEGADKMIDYLNGVGDIPRADVLKFVWRDGSWAAVRPSGTEPKIKFYYSIRGNDEKAAHERLERIRNAVKAAVGE